MTLKIGDAAPAVAFGGPEGNVALSDLYAEGTVVLAFLRHFG